MMQQLFEVDNKNECANKNTDRNGQLKMYNLQHFKPPISVLRYISKITSQMYFVTSKSSFEKLYFVTSKSKKIYSSKVTK